MPKYSTYIQIWQGYALKLFNFGEGSNSHFLFSPQTKTTLFIIKYLIESSR